ncbi:MAG: phosphate ABC transporter ATP-binding protein PstB [Candidatus Aquicultor sp.]|nr:phosphate ABC transporter ATP-binding protein PstB [Candidatus Aquicultor sp.]
MILKDPAKDSIKDPFVPLTIPGALEKNRNGDQKSLLGNQKNLLKGEKASLKNQENSLRMEVKNLDAWYSSGQVLERINLPIFENEILALIGPSGCGKSTFLRCLNRLNDLIKSFRLQGQIKLDDFDIYDPGIDLAILRRKVGMVFQHPNPFPMSIFDNVAFGVREINRRIKRTELAEIVEESLRQASLWDEVKDKLNVSGLSLSGGQQQRLCIARALAVRPEIIMLDEPCSSLDPVSTAHIEELLLMLRADYTIIIVTHNLAQARRISHRMAFFLSGRLIEHGNTAEMSIRPQCEETENYLCGRFG